MFNSPKVKYLSFAVTVAAALTASCSRSAPSPSATTVSAANNSAADSTIEVEIVQPAAIEGAIKATGKVLVMENRTATIGPVHEGRIVNLYAGQ